MRPAPKRVKHGGDVRDEGGVVGGFPGVGRGASNAPWASEGQSRKGLC